MGKSGKCVMLCQGHQQPVISVSFSSDGRFVTTVQRDRQARLWELSTGRCEGKQEDVDPEPAMTVAPGGQLVLATAQDDCSAVLVCSALSGTLQLRLTGHTDEVLWASFVALKRPPMKRKRLKNIVRIASSIAI